MNELKQVIITKLAKVLTGDALKKLRLQNLREAKENGGKVKTLKEVLKMKNFLIKVDRPIGKYRGGKDWAGMVYPVNYGEIPNIINPSDGDPWDVLVPGPITPKKTIRVKKIIGYVPLSDGNHKLIGTYKAKTRINLKQVMEYVKRRRRQSVKNADDHVVKDIVILP